MRIIFKTSYDADIRYFSNRVPALWYVALLLLATTLPFIINEFWLGEFTLMLIWAIAFMAVGAYSNVILQEYGVPFILSLPLAGIFAGLAGVLVAIPTTKLHGIYMAIATIAIGVLAEDLIVILEPWTGGESG